MSGLLRSIGAAVVISIPLSASVYAASSKFDIDSELDKIRSREKECRHEIAREQVAIHHLKDSIDVVQRRIEAIRAKKYSIVGITPTEADSISMAIDVLHLDIKRFDGSSDSGHQAVSLQSLQSRLSGLRQHPASRLPLFKNRLFELSGILKTHENESAGPPKLSASIDNTAGSEIGESPVDSITSEPGTDRYTVKKNEGSPETLFDIANRVYGAPDGWKKIYHANKTLIDSMYESFNGKNRPGLYSEPSDLIFPGQELIIPR